MRRHRCSGSHGGSSGERGDGSRRCVMGVGLHRVTPGHTGDYACGCRHFTTGVIRLSHSGHHLFGRFGHGVGSDDRETRFRENLLAGFFVGALHADHQRHGQADRLGSSDHAFGNGVALHDAAEDVDQDGLHVLVLQHDLEGFGHLLGGGTAAHVEEVGRLAAVQLDRVHGGHGQAGTVHQAADVAVQADVGQVELGSLDFSRILFVQVAVGHDLGMAEQGVAVEVELGVQGDDVALAVTVQRVDLDQGSVRVHVALVQLLADVDELRLGVFGHADTLGQFFALLGGQAGCGIDEHLDDLLGGGVGHFLDVHAAFAGSDEGHLLGAAVGHAGQVVFLLDVGAFLDVQAADLLAFGAGLVRLELHAQDVASQGLDVVDGLGNLHAAALATAARMDLSLHHPHRATQLLGCFNGFLNGKRGNAARYGHSKLAQDFLALVLMNLHAVSLL